MPWNASCDGLACEEHHSAMEEQFPLGAISHGGNGRFFLSGCVKAGETAGSVAVLHFGRVRPTGRRDDAIKAKIKRHLAVMIGGVPDDGRSKAKACIGTGVWPF